MQKPSLITAPANRLYPARYLFAYGTLQRKEINDINRLQPVPRLMGTARIPGTLYDLGAYPGIVLGEPNWVVGEVYCIAPLLEDMLDEIEEIGPSQDDEYVKVELTVSMDGSGRQLKCLVYALNPLHLLDLGKIRNPVASGDWKRFCAER